MPEANPLVVQLHENIILSKEMLDIYIYISIAYTLRAPPWCRRPLFLGRTSRRRGTECTPERKEVQAEPQAAKMPRRLTSPGLA